MPTTKAEGRSISFKPSSLYERAQKYGQSLETVLNPSEVTCVALKEFLDREAPESQTELSIALAQIRAASAKDPELAAGVLAYIRDRKRTRRPGR